MARLIYSAIASLDGYVADAAGDFSWAAPDEEVHGFINELERPVGTYLYGRRMYEVMRFWEEVPDLAAEPPVIREFAAIWAAADKVVYSSTLPDVSGERTRLERVFDPEAVRRLVLGEERDVGIGGSQLAGQALAAGLVQELQLFQVPVLVGGGKRCLPEGMRLDLTLCEERRFAGGVVFLRYRVGG